VVPLFDEHVEKEISNFVPKYMVPELSTRQICHGQGRSRSASIHSFAKHSEATDED
jgi:hypothetical protein